MGVIVNNVSIYNDFKFMISKYNNKKINTIFLYSATVKVKTTVINYLADFCAENEISHVLTDFNESKWSLNYLIDFYENAIIEIQSSISEDISFTNYHSAVKDWMAKKECNNVVLEKMAMVHTTIGQVIIQPNNETQEQYYYHSISKAFFKDLKSIGKKIVFFIDHFEKAPSETQNIIIDYFLRLNMIKPNVFLVIATGENILKDMSPRNLNHIKLSMLPDEYKYEDWKKYCNEVCVDEMLLKPIYKLYKDNPMIMRIALKPHEGWKIT